MLEAIWKLAVELSEVLPEVYKRRWSQGVCPLLSII
jgi:hypothetical protein